MDGLLLVDDMVVAHIVIDPESKDLMPLMRLTPQVFQSWLSGEKAFLSPHLSARLFKDGLEHKVR